MNKFIKYLTRRESYRGFTLIELLISISIFSLLSTFLVINYRDDEKVRVLKNQAQEIVAGLQKVQNMALTGEDVAEQTPLSYKFFIADCDGNCSYKLTALFSASEEVISNKSLDMVSVNIKESNQLIVNFSSPRGKMLIQPSVDSEPINVANIDISYNEVHYCIKLNSVSGRIDLVSGPCP